MIWNRKKTGITAAAVVAAAAIAAGGIAVAQAQDSAQPTTPSATSTASPSAGGSTKAGKGHQDRKGLQAALTKLKDVQHAQWVVKEGTTGTYVTHDAIRGAVTAISPTSITVKAGDGVSETYALASTTKITVRGAKGAKPSSGTSSDVTSGATVVVTGTGTSSLTADRVVVPAA